MAKQDIKLGVEPAGTGGDTNRSANVKVNANFTELYKAMGAVLANANSGAEGAVLPTTGLPIANGGTGATTAAKARENLGLVPTTSQSDQTEGRLLKVGDFGIGITGGAPTINTTLETLPKGVFRMSGATASSEGFKPTGGDLNFLVLGSGGYQTILGRFNTNDHLHLAFGKGSAATKENAYIYHSKSNIAYTTTTAELPNLYVESSGELKRSTKTLGTAATGTLTTSNTDSTVGRVLKVGDFGLGSSSTNSNANIFAPENFGDIPNGNYYVSTSGNTEEGTSGFLGKAFITLATNNAGFKHAIGFDATSRKFLMRVGRNGEWESWKEIRSEANTTVDSNGFIKNASPIVELYADHIELNDEAKQQEIVFEKLGTGDYLIKGSSGFAQEGWYVEQPKDVNGNVYHAVVYEQLENGDISVKTYEQKLDGVKVVADLDKPVDIKENRFISIRLQELPQEPIEEGEAPQPEPEQLDNEGNPTPSRLHELVNGAWTISEENAAILEQERLEAMPALTRRQFRLVLVLNGYDLAQIETLINSIEDAMQRQITMIEWQDATTFHRTNPSLLAMAAMMGLTTAQVDALWSQALGL